MTQTATATPTERVEASQKLRLVTTQEHSAEAVRARATGAALQRRYFHSLEDDGESLRVVTLSRDGRISCTCTVARQRVATGMGDVCRHVEEALDMLDAVGWNRLPTWKCEYFPKDNWIRTA